MSAQLSKLHVRYIQTQKSFSLLTNAGTTEKKLPLFQLYIKDNGNFYLILKENPVHEKTMSILFKEPTDALKTLRCDVLVSEIAKTDDSFEDTLLFFNTDTSKVKQVLLLNIDAIEGN